MSKMERFGKLGFTLAQVVTNDGTRPPKDETLPEFCKLSVELYEGGQITAADMSWASLIARRYYLLPEIKYNNSVQVFDTSNLLEA